MALNVVKAKRGKNNPSFHESIGPVLAVGQFFGMLPVDGVLSKDVDYLEFRWKSPKTIYSMIFLLFGTIESCLGTRRLLRLGFNIHFAEGLSFFITAMVKSIMMFQLARKWKMIMKTWQSCEDFFLKPPYCIKGINLKTKLVAVSSFLLIFTFGKINQQNFSSK